MYLGTGTGTRVPTRYPGYLGTGYGYLIFHATLKLLCKLQQCKLQHLGTQLQQEALLLVLVPVQMYLGTPVPGCPVVVGVHVWYPTTHMYHAVIW